jgi:hypothetical protein
LNKIIFVIHVVKKQTNIKKNHIFLSQKRTTIKTNQFLDNLKGQKRSFKKFHGKWFNRQHGKDSRTRYLILQQWWFFQAKQSKIKEWYEYLDRLGSILPIIDLYIKLWRNKSCWANQNQLKACSRDVQYISTGFFVKTCRPCF